jgi:hypothetical protein
LSDCQDGQQDDRVKPLIQQYSLILDRYLEADTKLAKFVVCCAGCGIRFLTHPRNHGRADLRCPFGCRQRRRRECGNERSRRYYQTPQGRQAKESRNAARTGWPTPEDPSLPLAASDDPDVSEISKDSEVADGLLLSSHSAALHAVDVRDGSAVVDPSEVTDGSPAVADALGTADSVGATDSVGAVNVLAAAEGVVVADAAGPKRCSVRGCEAPPELVALSIPLPSETSAPGEDPLVWELGGVKLTAWLVATTPVLPYVQLLVKEIGSLRLCRDCLIKWLLEKLRQRSMIFSLHRQYALRFLHLHPP